MKLHKLSVCEGLIDYYRSKGGNVITLQEGSLGLGQVLLTADGLKNAIITEKYLNEWSSAHTIRFYSKLPKKYQAMADENG